MKNYIVLMIVAVCLGFGLSSEVKDQPAVNIHIQAKSEDNKNPIYVQIMEFGDNRKFIQSDDGSFDLTLTTDRIYSVYVGQKGQQTYLFNINTHIEEMLVGNFSFSIDVKLTPKVENGPNKRIHDIEITSDKNNKPTLLFKKKN
ncbi:MAG: hypothetical protein HKN39_06070 [Flavobacteriales bacterium]|nr:hypothetical protein [Flavobacteriales bacterium]